MKTTTDMQNKLKEMEGPLAHGDFRRFLQETLLQRCKLNPSYSLRAFARQLGLEPSYLSKLLSGSRKAQATTIMKLASKLSLGPVEVKHFIDNLPAKKKKTTNASALKKDFHNLAIDHFKMIADWYHYAILELTLVHDFQSDAGWISKKLGISKIEAQAAIERLERLEMLVKDEDGRYQNASGNNTTIGNEFTTIAFRRLQKQILLQALHALENIPMELRDQSSMTMAIDPELLPEAKKKIKEFRRELCDFLQENGRPKKQIYQLSTSLFPVQNRRNL